MTGEQALLDAVRDCWASLFASRATSYLAQHGDAGAMAVVAQRMAPAVAAGVAFSADPLNGDRCVIIEAVRGLGSAVASGIARADRYVIDGRGVLAEIAPVVAGQPALSEAQALELAAIVSDIERLAAGPQDVEWAWDGAIFHILQARPITTLAGRHVYSSRLVADMAPGLVKPLVYDVNTLAKVREVFGALFAALLGSNDLDTSQLVTRLYSRVYADTTVIGDVLAAAGLPANLFESMLRDERSAHVRIRMSPRMLGVALRMVKLVVKAGRLGGQQIRILHDGRLALEPFAARNWTGLELPELLVELERVTALRDGLFWFFFCCVFNSAVRTKILRSWVARHAPDVAFGELVRGLAGLKSLEPSLELAQLAETARGLDEADRAALFEADDLDLRRRLAGSAQGRVLLDRLGVFLDRYGYLSSNGSDFSSPSWNESPALIWRSIAAALAPARLRRNARPPWFRAAASERVCRSIGPVDRWAFGRLMAGASTAIEMRERASVLISKYGYEMRRLFLSVAGQLAGRGDLDSVEDIFYLTRREMESLAQGLMDSEAARACIRERRSAMAADAQIDPPDMIVAAPGQASLPVAVQERVDGLEYLSGISGSPGLVRGIACVIHDPIDAPSTLGRSDILVVPFSDVGWTPLFAGIGGIVAETGGQLSHTAIVAREYNLPAVVSVRDATRRICNGQPLTVDGSQGRVYLRAESV